MRHLGEEFARAGHEPALVTPGPRGTETGTAAGLHVELAGPAVPGMGYRVLVGRRAVQDTLSRLEPDVLEVSDRTTLRWVGAWARARGIPTVMVSRESLATATRSCGRCASPGQPLLVYCGRLSPEKRVDRPVEALTFAWVLAR